MAKRVRVIRHGTISGYKHSRCKCEPCKLAASIHRMAYAKEYRKMCKEERMKDSK